MDQLWILWMDAYGHTRLLSYYVQIGGAADVVPLLAACSNAVIVWWAAGTVVDQEPVTAEGAYPLVDDHVRIECKDAMGNRVSVVLPAPKDDVFWDDGVTLDEAAVSGLIAAIREEVISVHGWAVTDVLPSHRGQRRTRS